jgi:trigger factor
MVERRLDALVEEVFEGLGNRRPPASREARLRSRLRSELHDRARDQVKATLVLDAIAAQEHLAVATQTLEARIERVAASAAQARERCAPSTTIRARAPGLRSRLLQERALDLVIARAPISDVDAPSGVAGVPGNG